MVASPRLPPKASDIFELISRSACETEQLGERLGACVSAGDVVGLTGELGTGKTTLIRGLAKGLGIDPNLVRSPTFMLMREYPGRVPLIHVDGYRLNQPGSAVWEDLAWIFTPTKITVIEWAERLHGCLPEDYLELELAHRTTNQRTIRAIGHGPRSHNLVETVQRGLSPPR